MSSLELALIGNCCVSALIDTRASMTWACLPRLDDDPVFTALLDDDNADQGRFDLALAHQSDLEQHYVRNTAVLRTVLTDKAGQQAEIFDFAPRFEQYGRFFHPRMLVRHIRPLKGTPRLKAHIAPMTEFGQPPHQITHGSHHIRYVGEQRTLRLTSNAPITSLQDGMPFLVDTPITLIFGDDETITESPDTLGERFLTRTTQYWQAWVRNLSIPYEWQDVVIRSAITLKLNTFEDTGAVIAAVTSSIPESADSSRNWDYRFCWLRDACFVVAALNQLGVTQTMEGFLRYIINIAADSEDGYLQPVYKLNGQGRIHESQVASLAGYRGMGPVRVGNDAWQQVQNDVYGSVILAAGHMFLDQRLPRAGDLPLFEQLERLGTKAARMFDQPDAGLWEFRGRAEVHTFSAVMCWAACNTLARIAGHLELPERQQHWTRTSRRIHEHICSEGWSDTRQSFVSSLGGDAMDASLLLLQRLGFLSADDPRFKATVEAIEQELRIDDFFYRYIAPDDFGVPDVSFTVCNFWYIDALVALGRKDEARRLYQRMVELRNRFGLLSEDVDPRTGELWGNFPQTYSMVGLINSARLLSKPWEDIF
ncbi:glycoside hydrolase family 15 protein [Larsenimonas rhizosphaerae]|uniref:Glycoside hydrolase family 15 protein n=1 Tax=Larsenimonas rhizosphaerae TaxID=2944682 RepID=A0AA41ZM38_9GAMM|nr:glycoside hydrolase family 15 protein [Larsenimonas rhizosphaerae]MCX2523365.1 glycoside hydrolase family 15 protein [Larsenimonas rhizosphaerae]